jgi:tRNA(Leu) C34 or U34 (ribose-2'-O)-methylase TrmL
METGAVPRFERAVILRLVEANPSISKHALAALVRAALDVELSVAVRYLDMLEESLDLYKSWVDTSMHLTSEGQHTLDTFKNDFRHTLLLLL